MVETIQTVGVVAVSECKVLLVRHCEKASQETGVFGLPGGKLEPQETELEAAKREFIEETSLTVSSNDFQKLPKKYNARIEMKDGSNKNYSFTVFLCRKFSGKISGNEKTMPKWVEIASLEGLPLLPNVKKAIKQGLLFLKS